MPIVCTSLKLTTIKLIIISKKKTFPYKCQNDLYHQNPADQYITLIKVRKPSSLIYQKKKKKKKRTLNSRTSLSVPRISFSFFFFWVSTMFTSCCQNSDYNSSTSRLMEHWRNWYANFFFTTLISKGITNTTLCCNHTTPLKYHIKSDTFKIYSYQLLYFKKNWYLWPLLKYPR